MGADQFWDEQETLQNRARDYMRLGDEGFNTKYAPTYQQRQSKWQEGKVPVNISKESAYRPKKTFQDNQFYQYGFEQPVGTDPVTGETITQYVSPEDYAGKTAYMSPEESEKYNRQMLADNRENFMTSPIYFAPGLIASGAALAPTWAGGAGGLSTFLNAAPIASMPSLTAGNAINAGFAYEALKDDGLVEQTYDDFQKGDYGSAAENAIYSGLSLAPYAKAAKNLYNIGKGLGTAGTTQRIATSLPFSAKYTSPAGASLAIQNPGWTNATKQILPNTTKKFNKTFGDVLGEFELYGTSAKGTPKTQNILSGASTTANQIPGDKYNQLPTKRITNTLPAETNIPEHQLQQYAATGARDMAESPYPMVGRQEKPMTTIFDDANFNQFSPGWQAQQELSNLASFGKQPLLKPSDFATGRDIEIDNLFYKHRDNTELMNEAIKKGFTPDEVLKRVATNLGNKVDPARKSQRDFLDKSKPFNLDTHNTDIIRQGTYNPFAKNLNEYGSMGGKAPVSFGESAEFDQYYWDQIKRNEEFLSGDHNMSPETKSKIQSKVSDLYQKGINQGLQAKGFDLENPMKYTGYDAMRTLSPNQYGGELPEAQLGALVKYGANALSKLPYTKNLSGAMRSAGNYLSKNMALPAPYKLNPWAIKENPEVMLHRVQKPGQIDDLDLESLSKFNMGNSDLLDDFLIQGNQGFKPGRSASDVAHKMKAKELDLGLSAWSPENAKNNVQDPLSAGMYFFTGPASEKTSKFLNRILPSSFNTDTRNTITSHMHERLDKQFRNEFIDPYKPIPLWDSNTTYHLGDKYGVDWNRFAKKYITDHNEEILSSNINTREHETWRKELDWAKRNNLEKTWDEISKRHIFVDDTGTQVATPQFEPDTPILENPWQKNNGLELREGGYIPKAQTGLIKAVAKPLSKLDDVKDAFQTKLPLDKIIHSDEYGFTYNVKDILKHNSTLDDLRNERLEALQTPKGKLRLENYLKDNALMNTDQGKMLTQLRGHDTTFKSMQRLLGQDTYVPTYNDVLSGIADMKYGSTELIRYFENYEKGKDLHKGSAISTRQFREGVDKLQTLIDDLGYAPSRAYMGSALLAPNAGKSTLLIGSNYTPLDARITGRHEIAHYFQGSGKSHLDKELEKLTLNSENELGLHHVYKKEGNLPESYAKNHFLSEPNYMTNARNYWNTGSKGAEKTAFMEEARGMMLEDGTIKHIYDDITPEMIEKHYYDYMKGNTNYPLRIYDILDNTNPENFKIMSSVFNRLPGLAPVIGAGAAGAALANPWQKEETNTLYQTGGSIELDLTPEEIAWYKSQGYEVEDIINF